MKSIFERYSNNENQTNVATSTETFLTSLSPEEQAAWINQARQYDPLSQDLKLFANVAPEVLAALEDDNEETDDDDDMNKKPAAVSVATNKEPSPCTENSTKIVETTRQEKEYDLPSKDLFGAAARANLLAHATEEADEANSKKTAAIPKTTAKHGITYEPSLAMLNFQKSFANLSSEEQKLFQQVTPPTVENPKVKFWPMPENTNTTIWRTPGIDITNISNISSISDTSGFYTGVNHLLQQSILPPDFQNEEPSASSNSQETAAPTEPADIIDPTVDPLEALMCSSRLTIYKELIKELASSAVAATNALHQKTSAAAKLHDPLLNPTPRSIRNNLFTLTTIAEFRDHEYFKTLQMKAAGICEQYKEQLTATIRELATNEITWLKMLRVQRIIQKLKPIIASLLYKLDHITNRPDLPDLATKDTIQFFMFYWLIQLSLQTKHRCYSTFFGLPINDIITTAANILIENNKIIIGYIVENLHQTALDWDHNNKATGYYVTTILRDLDAIINGAVFDYVAYTQTQKNAKTVDAQVQAFVNKIRVKNATELTNEALGKVKKQVKTDNINEQDLRRRQLELEKIIAKQNERINHFVKEQQKNSNGRPSALRPSQFKSNSPQLPTSYKTIRFTPAPPSTIYAANPSDHPAKAKMPPTEKPSTSQSHQPKKKKRKFFHKK